MNALAFGEILWDMIDDEHHLGGAPLNFAAHVSQCGGQSAIISQVGADALGDRALEQAKDLRVDVRWVTRSNDDPTGTVDVFLRDGQPDYTIHEQVAYDKIRLPDIDALKQSDYDVFYFGTLAQRSEHNSQILSQLLNEIQFPHIFYDINLRKSYYSRTIIERSLKQSNIFKINDAEAATVSQLLWNKNFGLETFSKKIAEEYEIDIVIITAAERGCFVMRRGGLVHIPGHHIQVVDAVGAGDSFSAAFMTVYLNSHDVISAANVANQVGAFVASSRGAIPVYPKRIRELLN